jgi:hypothetical protein
MKEKILHQLKASVVGSDGKTSLCDKTLNAYADLLAAQISKEPKIPDAVKPYAEVLKVVQGNINHVAAASAGEKEAALKAEYEKRIEELKKQLPTPGEPKPDDMEAKVKASFEAQTTPLKQEVEAYKAKEAAGEKRNALILAKAKELGIPQSRIDEGFAIASDADEAKIGEYLARVANVIAGGTTTAPRVVKGTMFQIGDVVMKEGETTGKTVTLKIDKLAQRIFT